jgi:hypothetical protein
MSPKEPPPIFFESRYFLPTRSSILAFTNGEATMRCATAACGAAEHKVVSHGRTQRIWAPASHVYRHGERHNSLGFEAHRGAGTTARAASRPCCAPRAAGRAASTHHRSREGGVRPHRASLLPPRCLLLPSQLPRDLGQTRAQQTPRFERRPPGHAEGELTCGPAQATQLPPALFPWTGTAPFPHLCRLPAAHLDFSRVKNKNS